MTSRPSPIIPALASILFTLIAFSAFVTAAAAVAPPGVTGIWTGTLQAGCSPLRLVLHVTADSAGGLGVSLDSVDEGLIGLRGDKVAVKGKAFSFNLPSAGPPPADYQATISADGNTLNGTWRQGIPLPLVFTRTAAAPTPVAARPPVPLKDLKGVLDQELKPVLEHGLLSKPTGGGLVIGVLDHGERRIFTYGTARPDSIFEIGSITKTFTGLILAQMVVQKKVSLSEPVRSLLPPDFAGPRSPPEITLLELATHHSGLPRDPDNLEPENLSNPYVDYDARHLSQFLTKHGLARPPRAKFLYSNLGFGLLGYALSLRAGVSYARLVQTEITGPLHMHDTLVTMSPAQRKRLIQGYGALFNRAEPMDFDVFGGAGALKSTASDMLTYLDANLHPEKYAAGAAPGSPAATLPAAMALDHEPRADAGAGGKMALAWGINPKPYSLDHDGATYGNVSVAHFYPDQDWAVIVLNNRADPTDPLPVRFADCVAENVSALWSGEPALPLDFMSEADKSALSSLRHRPTTLEMVVVFAIVLVLALLLIGFLARYLS